MKQQFIKAAKKAIILAISVAMITGSVTFTAHGSDSNGDTNYSNESRLAELLEIVENARDAVEEKLDAIETIIADSNLSNFENGTVTNENIGEVADLVDGASNAAQAANEASEHAQTAINAAEEALEIAQEAFEAAQDAIEAAQDAIETAEAAVEAANIAIQAAIEAEENFNKARNILTNATLIRMAEEEMITRREAAIATQKAAEAAIADKEAAGREVWELLSAALDAALIAFEESITSFEKAVTQAEIEDAARQKIEANRAMADALYAQLNALSLTAIANAAIEHSNIVGAMAQAVINTALETIHLAETAVESANYMIATVNKIIESVEEFIIGIISQQDGVIDIRNIKDATFVDYVSFYYNFLREMALMVYGYDIGPEKTAEDFKYMSVEEFNKVIDAMNKAVALILAHNATAYAEYNAMLQAIETAFKHAAAGTPEAALPSPIRTNAPITPITGGGANNHLFTTEFHPVFVNLLLTHWKDHNMHRNMSEEELLKKATDIANQGVLRRPDGTPWEMVSVVSGNNPTFKPDGNGNFIFTTTWSVHPNQQPSGQCQQIIAIDWNIPGGGVYSYVWFLEGIYTPGQEINLVFTEAMLRSISGHTFNENGGRGGSIVIKRIAYQEDLDQVLLQQLQALPTTFATIPTVPFAMEHPSFGDIELQIAEFTFSGFETRFDNFPNQNEEDDDTDDNGNKNNNGNEGDDDDKRDNNNDNDEPIRNILRVPNTTTSPPAITTDASINDIPSDDMPTNDTPADDIPLEDMPTDDVPIEDVPADDTPENDVPTDDIPVDDEPTTGPPPPQMPPTGVNNSITLLVIGFFISFAALILLGLVVKRRYLKHSQ